MKILTNPPMPLFNYSWKEENGRHKCSGVNHLPPRFAQVVRESPGTYILLISSALGQRMQPECTDIHYIGLQRQVIAI